MKINLAYGESLGSFVNASDSGAIYPHLLAPEINARPPQSNFFRWSWTAEEGDREVVPPVRMIMVAVDDESPEDGWDEDADDKGVLDE